MINPTLPFVAQRLFNTPLALTPHKADLIVAALAERLGIARVNGLSPAAAPRADTGNADPFAAPGVVERAGYDIVGGVAVIAVHGTLAHRWGTLRPYSGCTGYDGIRQNILAAMNDPAVRAIALDCDSGGGEVTGCFDLVDTIHGLRGRGKPIWAICAEHAFSAAYAIASAADRVTVPRTGGTGSVGVITLLVDWSKALTEEGVAVHFVHAGSRKAEEWRAESQGVKPELLARMQEEVDRLAGIFAGTIARNRSLDPAAVMALEAACLWGEQGVAAGLADAVAAPDAAFAELLAQLGATAT